jgi:DNA-binding NarL/FixJ family response regulator
MTTMMSPIAVGANAKTRIKVLLADDHAIVREGVRLCLEGMGDIDVVGEAEDGHQAVRLVGQLGPDVAVLDVTMPRLNGIEALRQIRRDHPRTRVVMLSMHDNEAYVTQALQAGASGYVLKRTAATELAAAIRAAHTGDVYLHPGVAKRVVADYLQRLGPDDATPAPHDRLTPREREVLQLIARGYMYKEIAARLHVSVKTVETHVSNVLRKLQLSTRHELARWATQHRLV